MRFTDDQVLAALGLHGRTHQVAKRLGMERGTSLARRYLLRLEKAGRVRRDERYSAANDIYWTPIPERNEHA